MIQEHYMNKEILNQVQNLNIAEVKDTGTLQELASIADELINSSNAQERFLAIKIKNRLEQNDHYQNLLKTDLIQKEEVKATADKQFERAYQVHRENSSIANLQTRKQEEVKESKAQEEFNKLTAQQQQAIIKLEYLYLPELRQQVREFILDDTKATPENFAGIINKQIKSEAVLVEKDKDGNEYITLSEDTTTEKANEIEHIAQQTGDAAIEAGKMKPAVVAYSTVNAANVKEADNNFEEGKEEAYRIFQAKTAENKTAIDIQGIAFQLNEEVFKKYAENLQNLEGVSKEEKEELLVEYENDLTKYINKILTKHNIDLSNDEQKELFVKSVLTNYTTLSEQQLKNILVKNCGIEADFVENFIKKEQKQKEEAAIVDEIDTPAPAKEITLQKPLIKEYDQSSTKTWDETITEKNEKTYNEELYPKAVKTEEEIKAAELTHTNQNKETATVAIIDINNK